MKLPVRLLAISALLQFSFSPEGFSLASHAFAHGDHSGHHHHDHGQPQEGNASSVISVPMEQQGRSADADEISKQLSEAVKLTAKGDLDGARRAYESVATDFPPQGLPALARFYHLTSSDEQLNQFFESLENDESLGALTIARTFVQGGDRDRAINLLMEVADAASGDLADSETVIYLIQLLDRKGADEQATGLAIDYMKRVGEGEEAIDVAWHLATRSTTMQYSDPVTVISLLESAFEKDQIDFQTLSGLLDQMLNGFINSETFFVSRKELTTEVISSGPLFRLFVSRLLLGEGQPFDSLEALESGNDLLEPESWLAFHVSREAILRNNAIGEYARADEIRSSIEEHESANSDAFTSFLAVRTALQQDELDRARDFMANIDPDNLQGEESHDYYLTEIRLAANEADLEKVIELYSQYFENYEIVNLDLIARMIFSEIINTRTHLELEEVIRKKFADDPQTDSILWLLAAESAKESRLKPNELEATYQYLLANPSDVERLHKLVVELVPIAVDLQKATEEELLAFGIPVGEPERLLNLAETTTIALIEARPFAPEPLRRRMELLRGTESSDEEVKAVVDIVAAETNNPRILGNAGYVLATEGFPEAAVGYYNRALEITPDDLKIRFNLASCHTRLGMWDEATEFYKLGLETGYRGKQWHVHEFVQRLWAIADTIGTKDSMLEYFHTVSERRDIPWRTEMISDMIAVMIRDDNFEQATRFREVMAESLKSSDNDSDLRTLARSWQTIASGYASKMEQDKSRKTLEEGIQYFEKHPEIVASLKRNLATLWVESGDSAKAIDILVELGTETEISQSADSWFYAATIAESDGDIPRAAQLYEKFLDSESRSFSLRRTASNRLQKIRVNPQ